MRWMIGSLMLETVDCMARGCRDGDACQNGATRFYDWDETESSHHCRGNRRASGPADTGHLAVGVPPLLHGPRLEPHSGVGGGRCAGTWEAYRHSGVAGHGIGGGAAVSFLSRSSLCGSRWEPHLSGL